MLIKKIVFHEIIKPLRLTFSTSLGKKNVIRSVLVKVYLKDGYYGISEVPTSFVVRNETIDVIQRVLTETIPEFVNTHIENYEEKIVQLRKKFFQTPMTISGLEVALFRAWLNYKNVIEYNYWREMFHSTDKLLNEIETDITLPFILNFKILKKWVVNKIRKGFKIFKLKTSGNIELDKKIVSYIYSVLLDNFANEEFLFRIDGNQGYNKKNFLQFLNFIQTNKYKIQLFEQPLNKKDFAGLKEVRKWCHIPIILDETVFNSEDMIRVIDNNLADGVNIKIAKSGISESIKIINLARKYKLKLMIGCMMETMVGLSAGINLALGSKIFDFIDLDSIYFLYHTNKYITIKISPPKYFVAY